MAYMNLSKCMRKEPHMNCRILLSPNKSMYNPGETVNGQVIIVHQKEISCLGFLVVLEGQAIVKLKEGGARTEKVVEVTNVLFGSPCDFTVGGVSSYDYKERIRLSPPSHHYSFSFEIPKDVPPTFKSAYGIINYQIVAYLRTEWRMAKKCEKTINIASFLDLSTIEPPVSTPSVLERTSKRTPTFGLNLTLPKGTGVIPGEVVPFDLDIGLGRHELESVTVSLAQRQMYRGRCTDTSSRGTKSATFVLLSKSLTNGTVNDEGNVSWQDSITIPDKDLMASQDEGIITNQYFIRVEVNCKHEQPLRGEQTIVIGTTYGTTQDQVDGTEEAEGSSSSKSVPEKSPSTSRSSGADEHRHFMPSLSSSSLPTYSQLSLAGTRHRSNSAETLPPTYEEALDEDSEPGVSSKYTPSLDTNDLIGRTCQ